MFDDVLIFLTDDEIELYHDTMNVTYDYLRDKIQINCQECGTLFEIESSKDKHCVYCGSEVDV